MRHSWKSIAERLWPLALLALPGCAQIIGIKDWATPNTKYGTQPWGDVIFCDIESSVTADVRRCATPDDLDPQAGGGIALTQAAVALTKGQSSRIGLDYSPSAIASLGCAPGQPVAITFRGPFPTGLSQCINCGGLIGTDYPDVNAACVAICKDLSPGNTAFCDDPLHIHRASTNAASCILGACQDNALPQTFVDPRRTPEPVVWTDLVGTAANGPDLSRTAADTGSFDAGAASVATQTITHGDGYVEFTATETDKARICGLSSSTTPETAATPADIQFGIRLTFGSNILVSEAGTLVLGPDGASNFGSYASGDRLRVSVTDNFDGTANIAYALVPADCAAAGCDGTVFRTAGPAPYPFRVDASFNQTGGTLTDVRIVRIQ